MKWTTIYSCLKTSPSPNPSKLLCAPVVYMHFGDIRICNLQRNTPILETPQKLQIPMYFEAVSRLWTDLYRYSCCCWCEDSGIQSRSPWKFRIGRQIPQTIAAQKCCSQKLLWKPEKSEIHGMVTHLPPHDTAMEFIQSRYGQTSWMYDVTAAHVSTATMNDSGTYTHRNDSSYADDIWKKKTIRMYHNRRLWNICGKVNMITIARAKDYSTPDVEAAFAAMVSFVTSGKLFLSTLIHMNAHWAKIKMIVIGVPLGLDMQVDHVGIIGGNNHLCNKESIRDRNEWGVCIIGHLVQEPHFGITAVFWSTN